MTVNDAIGILPVFPRLPANSDVKDVGLRLCDSGAASYDLGQLSSADEAGQRTSQALIE